MSERLKGPFFRTLFPKVFSDKELRATKEANERRVVRNVGLSKPALFAGRYITEADIAKRKKELGITKPSE